VPYPNDVDHALPVLDVVDDSEITDSDPPKALGPLQPLGARRTWFLRKSFDALEDASDVPRVE